MWKKVKANARLSYEILFAAGQEFGHDKVGRMAAAVAYRSMFALAPLFLLAVSVSGLVLGSGVAESEILTRVDVFAGNGVSDALRTFIDSVKVSGSTAAVLGIALLFWTASSLFIELQSDLNDIFHVPQERIEGVMGFVRKRTIGFLWVLGVGILLIALGLLNAAWRFLGDEILPPDAGNLHVVIGVLAPLVSLIVLPLIFALFFQTMSAVKVHWRAVWWGSVFTSVTFLAAAYGVGQYFSWNQDTSAPQVAASIFVILLLVFVLSTVSLFGAEVIKTYDDYLEQGDVRPPSARGILPRPEAIARQDEPALPLAAVFGFLAGLFVGWRRRS